MGLKRITVPAQPVVTVAEAKVHIGQYDGDFDERITTLCAAATELAEKYTGRALVTQTWRLSLNSFPWRESGAGYVYSQPFTPRADIRIPRPPLQSVTSIQYTDENGTTQTLDSSLYKVTTDLEPARIEPAYNQVWPATRCERESVRVTYVAGYGDTSDSVPQGIRHAILLMVSQWFENPESTVSGLTSQIQMNAQWLLDSFKTGAAAEWYELAE